MLRTLPQVLGAIALAVWLAACGSPAPPLPQLPDGPADRVIHVVSNGWHTGLVIDRGDLPAGRIPEAGDFPDARYLEFGWGDREYYPSRDPTVGMALAAALTPSPAVLHLAGRAARPLSAAPDIEVLAVRLTSPGLDRLVARIDEAFERPAGGRAAIVSPGLYPDSHFYNAHGEFHLFNTCNTWVADNLAAAGVPLRPGVITADDLMDRLREALAQPPPNSPAQATLPSRPP